MNRRITALTPQFVDSVPMPEAMQPGALYISIKYDSASHRCACGCGLEVVTPLSRSGWTLHYDGTVSLTPSIGNQEIRCRSHYWIRNNQIQWLPQFTYEQVQAVRRGHRMPPTARAQTAGGGIRGFLRRLIGKE